jgi:outer membrane lipoprotein-sorting protein
VRKTTLLIAGIAIGMFLAKQIEENPETKKSLDSASAKVKDFANAVATGYREQESKSTTTKPVRKQPTSAKRVR